MSFISNEYAKALFEIALDVSKSEDIKKELEYVNDVFQSNEEYSKIFYSPSIKVDEKKSLIEKVFNNVSKYTLHFLFVLMDNNRLNHLCDITLDYEKFLVEYNNKMIFNVTSVVELDHAQLLELTKKLEKKYNKEIIIKNHIDKNILGGLKIAHGNDILDLSVLSKLKSIEKKLTVK